MISFLDSAQGSLIYVNGTTYLEMYGNILTYYVSTIIFWYLWNTIVGGTPQSAVISVVQSPYASKHFYLFSTACFPSKSTNFTDIYNNTISDIQSSSNINVFYFIGNNNLTVTSNVVQNITAVIGQNLGTQTIQYLWLWNILCNVFDIM